MPELTPKLEALARILEQEAKVGFQDSKVVGGLDRFLQRWASELKPIIGGLGSYSGITAARRKSWAEQAAGKLAQIAGAGGKPARASKRRGGAGPRNAPGAKPLGKVSLSDPVARLKGMRRDTLPKLKRLGLENVGDLVYHFPHRHNDFAQVRKVSELQAGEEQTAIVNVWEASETRTGPRRSSTQAVLGDDTGNVRAIWFNQGYLAKSFKPGTKLVLSGRVNVFRGSFVFESPEYELLRGREELMHTGRLVPVYPIVERLPQRTLRRFVKQALEVGLSQVEEFLPEDSRHRLSLMGLRNAIAQAHYPDSPSQWQTARRRLAFDEMLLLQLAVLSRKRSWQQDAEGIPLKANEAALAAFLEGLPFELTGPQQTVLREILDDLAKDRPMSRLVQGDVGSGKTVVAAAALLVAAWSGHQGALMAPTEILAEQHFITVAHLLSGGSNAVEEGDLITVQPDSSAAPITLGLLIGSLPRKAKEEMHRRVAAGEVDMVIGTHALLQEDVDVPRLALAVVDEQHRFGVMQRAAIRGKATRPHLLAMSATPIPRSLALTLYGDLDISVIDELPPGRQEIRTRWVEPDRRAAAYGFIGKQVAEGRQAFVICPLIEESEAIQTRAAVKEYERLSSQVFPDLKLGLLHGRMALREKEEVMDEFKRGELHILVSTPVVEVGIDVPNATVMLIDGADRFGLAQLHQFRGRVGRGEHQSYCLLLADSPGKEARERLKIVERIKDGFELAEEDLRLRGPGDYVGTRQSGLPQFKVARITDQDILSLARKEAVRLLDADPHLEKGDNARLAERMRDIMLALTEEMS